MYKRRSLIVLFLGIFMFTTLITGCGKENEVVKETELTVATTEASIRDIAKSLKLSGVVKGENEVFVIAKTAARVTSVFVKPGDYVSQGQTIIVLDSSDYEAGVKQAEAGLSSANIQLDTAITNMDRMEKLFQAGAISTQQYEQAQTGLEAAQVGLEVSQAGLQIAQTYINNCLVTAPISGVIGSINVSIGEMASPSSPVAVVSNTSQLEIEVLASEAEINYIKLGEAAEIKVKAAADKVFQGKVSSVANVTDPMKRNYKVKISLPNEEGLMKSGMFAEVSITAESKAGVLSLPQAAILPKGEKTVVYTIDNEKRAREKEVIIGMENNSYVEIVSGINSGEEVITKGNTLVSEGFLVRVVAGGEK